VDGGGLSKTTGNGEGRRGGTTGDLLERLMIFLDRERERWGVTPGYVYKRDTVTIPEVHAASPAAASPPLPLADNVTDMEGCSNRTPGNGTSDVS